MTRSCTRPCAVALAAAPVRAAAAGLVVFAVAVALVPASTPARGQSASCPPASFSDRDAIPEVHRGSVDCGAQAGIIRGFGDGTYRPGLVVPRDQMAALLARTLDAAGVELPAATDQGFTDIGGNTHAADINRLAAAGIVRGTSSTSFAPAQQVRRDQVASLLLGAVAYSHGLLLSAVQGGGSPFRDIVGNAHEANIEGAYGLGIVRGLDGGTFAPHSGTRRDQKATLLMNALEVFADGELAVDVERMGYALAGFPTARGAMVDDRLFVFSLDIAPARIAEYDIAGRQVVRSVDIPTGLRPWAVATVGRHLYFATQVGVHGHNLFRYDTDGQELTRIASVNAGTQMAAAPDGTIYWGDGPVLKRYDPVTGDIRTVYLYPDTEHNIQPASVSESTIYAYTSRHRADLVTIDRVTGQEDHVLPPELADTAGIYSLTVTDELIIANASSGDPALMAVISRDDPSDYDIVEIAGETYSGASVVADDVVYVAGMSAGGLYTYDLVSGQLDRVATPVADTPTRNLFVHEERVIGLDAAGIVWEHPVGGGGVVRRDLIAAGAQGGPQVVHSLAAGHGRAYAAGNNVVEVHDRDRGGSERLRVRGEAKAMTPVGDRLYMALYPHASLGVLDPEAGNVELVVEWERSQNRPRDIAYDEGNGLVVVATQSDAEEVGAVVVYDPASGGHAVTVDPLDDGALGLSAVAAADGTVYLGTAESTPSVAAFDPVKGQVSWTATPSAVSGSIGGLRAHEGYLYGTTSGGWVFVIHRDSGQVVHTERVGTERLGQLQVDPRGTGVLVAGQSALRRIHGDGFAVINVISALTTPTIFGPVPPLAVDGQGDMFLLSGVDLLRVRARAPTG